MDRNYFDVSTRMDWVASYPKSGSTWVRLLLSAVYSQTVCEVKGGMDIGPYFFGCVSPVPIENLTPGQQYQMRPAALFHMAMRHGPVPSIIKTHHLNGSFMGVPLFSPQWVRRVIHVVRDPRDVLPSFAAHSQQSLETTAEQMGEKGAHQPDQERGHTQLGDWSTHTMSWLEAEERLPDAPQDEEPLRVLTVQFEELKADTAGTTRKMVDFLGYVDVTDAQIERAVEATDFDRLSEAEQKAREEYGAGFPERAREDQTFFRKGKSGGWREEVPPDLVEKIERDHGEMMQRLGYEREAVAAV